MSNTRTVTDLASHLHQEGIINDDVLGDIRKIQEKSSARVEQILLKKGVADEETILRSMAKFYGYEFNNRLEFKENEIFYTIPLDLIKKSRIVPYAIEQNRVMVALRDPNDLHPMDDIRGFLTDYRIRFVLTTETELARIIHSHYEKADTAAREIMEGMDDEFGDLDNINEDSLDLANDAPIIRMVNVILSQGVQDRASDIHIEAYERHMDVRYRVDGVLHVRHSPPKALHAGLVSRIKIMANLNIAENRLPQDGRIKQKLAGKDVDIRVSTIPTRYGERVVMRLLNKTDMKYSMEGMGFDDDMMRLMRSLIAEPNGILLVTGPTGSGKTTTLYSFLTELNDEERNILTAEDPVEYEIDGISQMQMQEKIGLTFATALRAMLRQDPDVIMVGEIRDEETARIAIQASLTGHLVLSTLHTNDAPSAITRLMDMGIEPYLITSTARAILAQRLVRRICPHCKTSYKPSPKELEEMGIQSSQLSGGKLYRGKGCEKCMGTGYQGRAGIYELLVLDEEIQRSIIQGSDSDSLKKLAISRNKMSTLFDYGKRKAAEGVTTIEEVLRVT